MMYATGWARCLGLHYWSHPSDLTVQMTCLEQGMSVIATVVQQPTHSFPTGYSSLYGTATAEVKNFPHDRTLGIEVKMHNVLTGRPALASLTPQAARDLILELESALSSM